MHAHLCLSKDLPAIVVLDPCELPDGSWSGRTDSAGRVSGRSRMRRLDVGRKRLLTFRADLGYKSGEDSCGQELTAAPTQCVTQVRRPDLRELRGVVKIHH